MNLGRPCPVVADADLPPRIINAAGRPIPKPLYDMLVTKRAELKASKVADGDGTGGASSNIVFFEGMGPGLTF